MDTPDGDGDLELYSLFDYGCANPTDIIVETVDGVSYKKTGQSVQLDTCLGFVCLNSENKQTCLDYRIKQCCPKPGHFMLNNQFDNLCVKLIHIFRT